MPVKYKKYTIKKGDTLESIAEFLNITLFELRRFHNNHCELPDLLGDKIPRHVKEILYESRESLRQNFSNISNNQPVNLTLPFNTHPVIYNVLISTSENEKENTLKYTLQIQWLQRNQVRIDRKNLFFNDQEPDIMADTLAAALNTVLYPAEFYLIPSGEITALSNFREIQNRWKQTLSRLSTQYNGDKFKEYCTANQEMLSDPELVFQAFKKDWALQAIFNGIYQTYENEDTRLQEHSFPLIPFIAPIQYNIKDHIETLQEEEKKYIKILRKGTVSDPRTLTDYANERDFPLPEEEASFPDTGGNYNALYFLDPASCIIEGLYLECTLELEKTKKAYITASRKPEKSRENKIIREKGILIIGKGIIEEDPEKPGPEPFSFLAE